MSKISLKTKLKNHENEEFNYEGLGVKTKNKIIFKENDLTVTLLLFSNKLEMRRYNENYEIKLIFDKELTTSGLYDIKCDGICAELKIKTQILEIDDNKIYIEYILYMGDELLGKNTYEIEVTYD